jgi:hypothetical protein
MITRKHEKLMVQTNGLRENKLQESPTLILAHKSFSKGNSNYIDEYRKTLADIVLLYKEDPDDFELSDVDSLIKSINNLLTDLEHNKTLSSAFDSFVKDHNVNDSLYALTDLTAGALDALEAKIGITSKTTVRHERITNFEQSIHKLLISLGSYNMVADKKNFLAAGMSINI